MPSKSKGDPQSESLFVNEQGEPLCFYLRPGPVKQYLLPLITAGGGLLCNVKKPDTILLKDPEERGSVRESTAHWYVSTKYIQDCIERNEKLDIEEYRLDPESKISAKRKTKSKVGSPAISGGRSAFTPEEDDAILRYVSKRVNEIGGNRLWQEMAQQQVTSHSWQSMKYHYRVQLAHRLSEYEQADAQKENKTDQSETGNQNDESASPQNISVESEDPENISSEMDLTQVSQTSDSQEEHTDSQPAECPENDSMETSKSEIDETPEQQQPAPAQPERTSAEEDGPTETTAKSDPNSNDKTSQNLVNRPVTRRQVELENVPYVKKLRSGTSPGSLFKWPQLLNKSKPVSSPKRDPREAQAPPRKVRRKNETNVADEVQEEPEESDAPQITQTDEGNCPTPKPTVKKSAKRKLGILEMATKEFEDDSESDSDLQNETPGPSTSTEAVIGSSDSAAPSTAPSENQEKEADTSQHKQNPQPSTTTTPAAPAPDADPAVPEPTTRGDPPLIEPPTSKAHLFIFENESQEPEDDSESVVGPSTSAAVQTNGHKNVLSLTQDQLEEDVQLLKDFMERTNQDLFSVTKALLKASGDVLLAHEILQNPSSFSGPVWTRTDDQRLCSTDSDVRQDLLTKYVFSPSHASFNVAWHHFSRSFTWQRYISRLSVPTCFRDSTVDSSCCRRVVSSSHLKHTAQSRVRA